MADCERFGKYLNITPLVRGQGLKHARIVQLLSEGSIKQTLNSYKVNDNVITNLIRNYDLEDIFLYEFRAKNQLWIHLSVAEPIFEALGIDYPGHDIQYHIVSSYAKVTNIFQDYPPLVKKLDRMIKFQEELEQLTEGEALDPNLSTIGYIIQCLIDYETSILSYMVRGKDRD